MKIPKLFKKAAAFVMAAVTALSIMPATAFAAGDIGTIFFSHTYDSNGNAMRYNSSANIGGYTAGGTGNYKYRMFVDGENAFCIQPGVPLKTGNTLKKASSDTWNALSANQKKAVGLALLYGYQGNRNNLSGSDDEKWLATQTLVWEFVTGCREATGSYNQTSTTVYSLHFGSNYANSGARAVYDQIVAMLREHNTIPSFMSGGKNDIIKELAYKDGKYSITLTDSNGVLSDYSFSSSDSNVSVSKSGNKLTISSTVAISGSVRITAKRNNVPTVSSSAKLIAYGDPNLQDLVTGVENADTVSAYINIETPTGTIALKKTSEDGVVEGISFTIKGDNFNKTVKTGKDGSVSVEGLFPGTYTVTEQSIDRYEPQKTQTVTLIGGKTSTVTFSNTLKRGSLEIVKTSEDNLVEGMKFHLYGTSLSGLPVDEYAVTDKNGLAKFENVLISGDTPYVVEEVDTAVRYVVPASQTAPIEWNKVTKRSFDNVLKKFQVTVTKTDAETGSPQGDASLAGAVYGIYKGEELIDTYTTDENGQFTTKYYICDNDWTVREISPSEGYLLDTAIHKVGAEPELYTVELNSTANDVNEQVIKGNIALIKHTDNGETQIETPEEGAVFEVFLKSAGSYENAKETERDVLTCDENGFAQTKDMPYGIYTVRQTFGWEGRELMKQIKTLISDISHQIKTPVAAANTFAQLLGDTGLSDEERREYIATLQMSLEKLTFLTNSLIKMSRLESGIIRLKPEQSSLNDIVMQAVKTVYAKARDKNITITFDCGQTFEALLDFNWTAEAVTNVLDNAVKYTPSGGVVDLKITEYPSYLRLDVSDNGIGIPEEEQAKIFGRFYRGKQSAGVDGVGIGLYLTRDIVNKQNGYIKVASDEKGTIFSLFLKKV